MQNPDALWFKYMKMPPDVKHFSEILYWINYQDFNSIGARGKPRAPALIPEPVVPSLRKLVYLMNDMGPNGV